MTYSELQNLLRRGIERIPADSRSFLPFLDFCARLNTDSSFPDARTALSLYLQSPDSRFIHNADFWMEQYGHTVPDGARKIEIPSGKQEIQTVYDYRDTLPARCPAGPALADEAELRRMLDRAGVPLADTSGERISLWVTDSVDRQLEDILLSMDLACSKNDRMPDKESTRRLLIQCASRMLRLRLGMPAEDTLPEGTEVFTAAPVGARFLGALMSLTGRLADEAADRIRNIREGVTERPAPPVIDPEAYEVWRIQKTLYPRAVILVGIPNGCITWGPDALITARVMGMESPETGWDAHGPSIRITSIARNRNPEVVRSLWRLNHDVRLVEGTIHNLTVRMERTASSYIPVGAEVHYQGKTMRVQRYFPEDSAVTLVDTEDPESFISADSEEIRNRIRRIQNLTAPLPPPRNEIVTDLDLARRFQANLNALQAYTAGLAPDPAALRQYSGWAGMERALDPENEIFAPMVSVLQNVYSPEQYRAFLAESREPAPFPSPEGCRKIWEEIASRVSSDSAVLIADHAPQFLQAMPENITCRVRAAVPDFQTRSMLAIAWPKVGFLDAVPEEITEPAVIGSMEPYGLPDLLSRMSPEARAYLILPPDFLTGGDPYLKETIARQGELVPSPVNPDPGRLTFLRKDSQSLPDWARPDPPTTVCLGNPRIPPEALSAFLRETLRCPETLYPDLTVTFHPFTGVWSVDGTFPDPCAPDLRFRFSDGRESPFRIFENVLNDPSHPFRPAFQRAFEEYLDSRPEIRGAIRPPEFGSPSENRVLLSRLDLRETADRLIRGQRHVIVISPFERARAFAFLREDRPDLAVSCDPSGEKPFDVLLLTPDAVNRLLPEGAHEEEAARMLSACDREILDSCRGMVNTRTLEEMMKRRSESEGAVPYRLEGGSGWNALRPDALTACLSDMNDRERRALVTLCRMLPDDMPVTLALGAKGPEVLYDALCALVPETMRGAGILHPHTFGRIFEGRFPERLPVMTRFQEPPEESVRNRVVDPTLEQIHQIRLLPRCAESLDKAFEIAVGERKLRACARGARVLRDTSPFSQVILCRPDPEIRRKLYALLREDGFREEEITTSPSDRPARVCVCRPEQFGAIRFSLCAIHVLEPGMTVPQPASPIPVIRYITGGTPDVYLTHLKNLRPALTRAALASPERFAGCPLSVSVLPSPEALADALNCSSRLRERANAENAIAAVYAENARLDTLAPVPLPDPRDAAPYLENLIADMSSILKKPQDEVRLFDRTEEEGGAVCARINEILEAHPEPAAEPIGSCHGLPVTLITGPAPAIGITGRNEYRFPAAGTRFLPVELKPVWNILPHLGRIRSALDGNTPDRSEEFRKVLADSLRKLRELDRQPHTGSPDRRPDR